jgi:hypothetical protein
MTATAGGAHALRAQAARRTITERFLAAAQETKPSWTGALGLPAFLSLTSLRATRDGCLSFSLSIPSGNMAEVLPALVSMAGKPLAVTIEAMDTDDLDPFDA